MATVYDVSGDALVYSAAKDLKEKVKFKKPDWADYVKTGTNRERAPESPDWWWVRSASILRRVYLEETGVQSLRTVYGGRKNRGVKPERFYKGSGKVIREILQEFDSIGFTEKTLKGRKVTPKGRQFLDKISSKLIKK